MWLRRLRHAYAKFGYVTYGYAIGYAKHGCTTCGYASYATVTPNSVTPYIVTPRGYAGYAIGYAKFGYAT